jgi:hypothetical protein
VKRPRFVSVLRPITPERLMVELHCSREHAEYLIGQGMTHAVARVAVAEPRLVSPWRRLAHVARADRARETAARICGE